MKRYDALKVMAQIVTPDDLVVTSVDWMKNEWYSVMPGDGTMFLSFMGGVTGFALGVALALPHRRVLAFDTDGSMLMNVGQMCTLANLRPPNLTALVFDNEMYEGVGGHPSPTSGHVDLERMAAGAGIPCTAAVSDPEGLAATVRGMLTDGQVGLLVLKIQPGRFTAFPPDKVKHGDGLEDKYRFIRHVERTEGILIKPGYVAR